MRRTPFALAAAATLSLAQPALAMESNTFAGDAPEAAPVVSVRVDDSDPDEGVCTGTAIDPHWVITARHCVDAAVVAAVGAAALAAGAAGAAGKRGGAA